MKLMKSAMLGSVAAFASVAGAQAADLPSTKSAPAEYVRVCDVYGAGFYYIPGTQTCLKVGGRVRFELQTQTLKNGIRTLSAGGLEVAKENRFLNKNGMDSLGWNSRGYISMDARTQSAWGTVQTVILLRANSTSGTLTGAASIHSAGVVTNPGATTITAENAYIRFAGFTIGRAYSNVTPIPPYMWNADQVGGFGAGIKQLAYTATFGGGFSATIGIEDKNDSTQSATGNFLTGNGTVLPGTVVAPGLITGVPAAAVVINSPARLPVVAGNLRVDQAWGWAQLSGAVGQNTANFPAPPFPAALAVVNGNGPLVKKTGWYVGAATRINLPMIAAGDHLHLNVSYANGLINYVGPELNGGGGKAGPYLGGLLRNDKSLTVFCGNAACTIGGSENTKAWSALAMFTHYWTPSVRQNFSASYQVVTPGSVTRNTDWSLGGLSRARQLTVGSNVIWSPVAGFDIGLELTYARLNQKFASAPGIAPSQMQAALAAAACPGVAIAATPTCFKASANVWSARMRVERTF